LKVTIIGSGGSSISPDRSLPAILVDRDVLLDCGEGTTQSLLRKLGSLESLKLVFLTHLHSDHVSGLLGLIWAMWLRESRKDPLSIIGPEKTEDTVMSLLKILNTPLDSVTFPLKFEELAPGDSYEKMVKTVQSIHNPVTLAYRFERDRTSFCYTGDTAPSETVSRLAKGCKLLIHDSAFPEEMAEKARKSNHSTSVGAATIAKEAGVKILVLFHWSSINEGKEDLLVGQAKRVFGGNVILARDGLEIPL
jgi:ribonuclease Z